MPNTKKYNIVFFGTKEDTIILLDHLKDTSNLPNLVVTLDPNVKKYHISGKGNVYDYCIKNNIELFSINDYSLNDKICKDFFTSNKFDLGISYGWQRIIPKHVLDSFKIGIFGFHGSPLGLPYGKGRSPFNHSIIEGKSNIFNHFFKYENGVDNGPFYSTTKFEINPFDNINSLNMKSLLIAKKEINNIIKDYNKNKIKTIEQDNSIKETFYPKRTPKDGKINLYQSTTDIYNFIRAITKPFPGAFLYLNNEKFVIWDAVPFDNILDFNTFKVGEIIDVLYGFPLMKTLDGSLLIKKTENKNIKKGDILL